MTCESDSRSGQLASLPLRVGVTTPIIPGLRLNEALVLAIPPSSSTDFASARAPKIAVASAADLFNINPADIFLKVRRHTCAHNGVSRPCVSLRTLAY